MAENGIDLHRPLWTFTYSHKPNLTVWILHAISYWSLKRGIDCFVLLFWRIDIESALIPFYTGETMHVAIGNFCDRHNVLYIQLTELTLCSIHKTGLVMCEWDGELNENQTKQSPSEMFYPKSLSKKQTFRNDFLSHIN